MASSMVELSPKLNSLVCYGAYGEKGIPDVCQNQFHKSTHLLFFFHVKDHIFKGHMDNFALENIIH